MRSKLALIGALVFSASVLLPLQSVSAAYSFTSHTFTACGTTGNTGPTQASCRSAYSTTWDESNANFTVVGGIQYWVAPYSGKFRIEAAGAKGGNGNGGTGGLGARMIGEFTLTEGETIRILVGQSGGNHPTVSGGVNATGGGGGGTFVVRSPFNTNASILVVAGGGGGSGSTSGGGAGQTSTSGQSGLGTGSGAGGVSGGGGGGAQNGAAGNASTDGGTGASCSYGSGGGGFFTNGGANCNGSAPVIRGLSFVSGGNGGPADSSNSGSTNTFGGFGGGAGSGHRAPGGGGYSGGGGDGGTTGGGGGGSYNSGLNQSNTSGVNSGDGYVTITSLGPSITTFAPTSTITNSANITYNLVFSEAVTGLASSDFSLTGTGSSTCTIGTPSGSGTTYSVALSGCSPGTVVLTIAANSVTNAVPQTAPTSNTDATTVTIDQTAPTISSVGAAGPGTYFTGNTPGFTVAFSESVTVSGTPRLTLTVGATTKYATLFSMSDSRTALFRYTVGSDPLEFDTDGIAISTSLDLNSGTIRDLATNSLSNLTFSAPTLTSVLVAQPAAAPTIDSITATSGQLAIYFTPGAARGSTTTTYQYSSNGGAFTNRPTGTTASPLILTGLTNGTGYTIRLRATTNAGAGDSSTAVTETPTSITVTGDSTLVLTYGNTASTSAYSASGGTNSFTWSLGSSLTGITLSGTTVTASASTPAGTYTQSVRATDTNSQVGSKTLTITVNRASTSISIALPNSATNAALGGAVTITATVSRAGNVNFMLGGTTISGCGSASAASTTATCSWTPNALGSVSLTATFTPTDSANFETSTTTTLSITVVNGVSTVTLSLAGGTTTPPKGQSINIIAVVDQAGRITFMIDGKRIPGCNNKVANVGNVTCSWKPAIQKESTITARLVPTNNVYNPSTSSLNVRVVRRSGLR